METKDGSVGFDFGGTYTLVEPQQKIEYTIEDGRKVQVLFSPEETSGCTVTETFEPESQNPIEMQQQGWQAILDNFKMYTETH
jgi:uncharacterized protein YndB with AHSA1/START domain